MLMAQNSLFKSVTRFLHAQMQKILESLHYQKHMWSELIFAGN